MGPEHRWDVAVHQHLEYVDPLFPLSARALVLNWWCNRSASETVLRMAAQTSVTVQSSVPIAHTAVLECATLFFLDFLSAVVVESSGRKLARILNRCINEISNLRHSNHRGRCGLAFKR